MAEWIDGLRAAADTAPADIPNFIERRVDDLKTEAAIAITSISDSHTEEMNDGDPHGRTLGDQP